MNVAVDFDALLGALSDCEVTLEEQPLSRLDLLDVLGTAGAVIDARPASVVYIEELTR